MNAEFFVRPGNNEWIKTEVTLDDEQSSVIHGVVKSGDGKLESDACVALYHSKQSREFKEALAVTFTDDSGEFILGPLVPGELYIIKVYKNNKKIRELEIITD